MHNERYQSGGMGFLAGAMIGGLIGAGVALLFAPQSGEDTRKMLRKKANELGKEFEEMKDNVNEQWKETTKKLSPQIHKMRDTIAKRFQGQTRTGSKQIKPE